MRRKKVRGGSKTKRKMGPLGYIREMDGDVRLEEAKK